MDDEPQGRATLHYFDRHFEHEAVKILPGEYMVTARDLLLVTVLGSCVAACVRDPELGIGGMNHFMLPDSDTQAATGDAARYGMFAMELLVNELMKHGARRRALEAKVFGGGNVLSALTSIDVGALNTRFVRDYLRQENIPIVAEDLLGKHPRKIHFFPATGRVMVKRLPSAHDEHVLDDESLYRSRLKGGTGHGTVELFGKGEQGGIELFGEDDNAG